jgi:hypothetical protein
MAFLLFQKITFAAFLKIVSFLTPLDSQFIIMLSVISSIMPLYSQYSYSCDGRQPSPSIKTFFHNLSFLLVIILAFHTFLYPFCLRCFSSVFPYYSAVSFICLSYYYSSPSSFFPLFNIKAFPSPIPFMPLSPSILLPMCLSPPFYSSSPHILAMTEDFPVL